MEYLKMMCRVKILRGFMKRYLPTTTLMILSPRTKLQYPKPYIKVSAGTNGLCLYVSGMSHGRGTGGTVPASGPPKEAWRNLLVTAGMLCVE